MGPVVVSCGGCGVRIRIRRPEAALERSCPRCGQPMLSAITRALEPEAELILPIRIDPDDEPGAGAGPVDVPEPAGSRAGRWPQVAIASVLVLPALLLGVWVALGQRPGPIPIPPTVEQSNSLALREPAPPVAPTPTTHHDAAAEEPPAASATSTAVEVDSEDDTTESVEVRDVNGDQAAQRGPSAAGTRVQPPASTTLSVAPGPAPLLHGAATSPATSSVVGGEARRLRIRTKSGETVIGRVYGFVDGKTSVLLPDGQIGFTAGMAETDEPFRPATFEKMRQDLTSSGRFSKFHVRQSEHYLVLYQSTPEFAEASIKLLENLYKNLSDAFRKRDIPIHDAEFPLVAIIFRTEHDFRAHQPVDPEVQAYYEILTNRIYFYQKSDRDQQSPEVAALRKPQTVAHEGTHQILQNIGIHPRLADWPLWLVEGLAEYCSPPTMTKRGAAWGGMGLVNAMHMATIHDLDDPASLVVKGTTRTPLGRDRKQPLVEYLVTRSQLTPTDYALSWALTHYLAMKKGTAFLKFLRTMSEVPPLEQRTPADQLAAFQAAFGNDLVKMDKAIAGHLAKLKYDPLPYYAVMFEQPIGRGQLRRGTIVSQSPSMIRQWIEQTTSPDGGPASWNIVPHPTKSRAMLTAQEWMNTH